MPITHNFVSTAPPVTGKVDSAAWNDEHTLPTAAEIGALSVESDPVFLASVAAGILSSDTTAWNAKQAALTFPLAASLGGTGINNGSATLTLPNFPITIAGGGSGQSYTLPAVGGTVALLGTANVFTAMQSIIGGYVETGAEQYPGYIHPMTLKPGADQHMFVTLGTGLTADYRAYFQWIDYNNLSKYTLGRNPYGDFQLFDVAASVHRYYAASGSVTYVNSVGTYEVIINGGADPNTGTGGLVIRSGTDASTVWASVTSAGLLVNNKVVIATTATSSALDSVSVTQTITAPSGQNTTHKGLVFQVNHYDSGYTNSGALYGVSGQAYQRDAGTMSNLMGLDATVGNYGAGGADHAGTISTLKGWNVTLVNVASATITDAYGGTIALPTSGTVVSGTGLAIAASSNAMTNKYGINIGNISGGSSNNYSVKTGTGLVYFGDAVTASSFETSGAYISTIAGAQFWKILGSAADSSGIGYRAYAVGSNFSVVSGVPTVDSSAPSWYSRAYAIGFAVEDSTDTGLSFWAGQGANNAMTLRMTINQTGIGFYNHTTTAQQVLATGASHTVDDVITVLQTIGLCKQS